jgi:hypothetical protein
LQEGIKVHESNLAPEIKGLTVGNVEGFGSLMTVTYKTDNRGEPLSELQIIQYSNALGRNGLKVVRVVLKERPVKQIVSIEFICERRVR